MMGIACDAPIDNDHCTQVPAGGFLSGGEGGVDGKNRNHVEECSH